MTNYLLTSKNNM